MVRPKGFYCDECDGFIDGYREYIKFRGMNYCVNCFDNHKHYIHEIDDFVVCDGCDERVYDDYYDFDGDIFCPDCVELMMFKTTQEEEMIAILEDRD